MGIFNRRIHAGQLVRGFHGSACFHAIATNSCIYATFASDPSPQTVVKMVCTSDTLNIQMSTAKCSLFEKAWSQKIDNWIWFSTRMFCSFCQVPNNPRPKPQKPKVKPNCWKIIFDKRLCNLGLQCFQTNKKDFCKI